jgi:hypothetical protein
MVLDFPDAAAIFSEWAWSIRFTHPQDAFLLLQKALQFNLTSSCKRTDFYTYTRYHYMGVVAFYVHEYEIGYMAAKTAFDVKNLEIDKTNMKYYPHDTNRDDL